MPSNNGRARRGLGRRRTRGIVLTLIVAGAAAGGLLFVGRDYWVGAPHVGWIAAWSVVTVLAYAVDKLAARAGKDAHGNSAWTRVDERSLHLMALLGGFVGGWIGRHVLRHKTRKRSFAWVLGVATVLHGGALAWRWSSVLS